MLQNSLSLYNVSTRFFSTRSLCIKSVSSNNFEKWVFYNVFFFLSFFLEFYLFYFKINVNEQGGQKTPVAARGPETRLSTGGRGDCPE